MASHGSSHRCGRPGRPLRAATHRPHPEEPRRVAQEIEQEANGAMAKKQSLKVFRTPIGFHDAYVAAPSQKAALEAWGSDADLFARGMAERVEEAALMEEPLAHPGKVIRRLRGTAEEQLASLPPDRPKRKTTTSKQNDRAVERRGRSVRKEPKPRPSRTALERAEQALEEARGRHAEVRMELDRRLQELQRERRKTADQHEEEAAKLEKALRAARASYDAAMETWRA
jgi:hypothetical protein